MSTEHRDRTPNHPEGTLPDSLAFLAERLNLSRVPTSAEELLLMLPPEDPNAAASDRHLSDQDVETVLRASSVLERSLSPDLRGRESVVGLSEYVSAASEIPSYRGSIVTEVVGQTRLRLHSVIDVGPYGPADDISAAQHAKHGSPLETEGSRYAYDTQRLFRLGLNLPDVFYFPELITQEGDWFNQALANPEGYVAQLNEDIMKNPKIGETSRVLGFLAPQQP